jgi:hypothetical protein
MQGLVPLDAIGKPIPGAKFNGTDKIASSMDGQALPRDFSGDIVPVMEFGTPLSSSGTPVPGGAVIGGNATGTFPGIVGPTTFEMDAAGNPIPVGNNSQLLGKDGMPLNGTSISPLGFPVNSTDNNPIAVDYAGNIVPFDKPGGSVLDPNGNPIIGSRINGNGALIGPTGAIPAPQGFCWVD